ncbi:hypothetical protein P5G65_20450 [Paenibacillus chondroitinus]|uniref:DUF559 domain-containing protein n=1 Tax=Paenibacillus chondroitinus TaxID=59842 RepID=A0ABU6DHE9_9BACL|nr:MULTISPECIES: hypothetical protein [Paenibacillus]MCY9661513.1 endonuclease domain-containing protein [Paenibacillus anseongense]MEB4796281.1 hypothetical protein [Paenibacillus chondroitinus]
MDFERLHASFFEKHAALRSGERKGRLVRGHAYAEKLFLQQVWMPLFGNFDNLHPEYEIYDWNRKSQFLDFAYMTPFGKFGIECDGFQNHVKEMDREKFSYALNRDTFLTALGWKMMHFSFDDIQSRPEICRMLLQMVVGPCTLRNDAAAPVPVMEKEVLRLAWMLGRAIRPQDVIQLFDVDFRTARKWLRGLVEKGCLSPMTTGNSVRSYEVKEGSWEHL